MTNKITLAEKAILFFPVLLPLAAGYLLYYTNTPLFDQYTREDGLLEWLTVIGLLLGSMLSFIQSAHMGQSKGRKLLPVPVLLGIFFFLAAGEEISWGQRILNIQTPEFFAENNTQDETNLHNLVLNGISINKLVFSIILIIALAAYLIIAPLLYHYTQWMKRLASSWGISIPRTYQILAFALFFGLSELLPHVKNAEFLENCAAYLMLMICAFPLNKADFSGQYIVEKYQNLFLNKKADTVRKIS